MSTPEPTVIIPAGQADDMAAALGLIEDWLLHTGDAVPADLGVFAFPCDSDQQRTERVTELISALGDYGVVLRRQLQTLF